MWTPDPAANLPVMVWIQGGGYLFGTSGLPEYDGGRLARDGGVVVVTFNYRVGIEGFAQIEGAPANRGLLDQVAALEWVRDNIGAFGGDPDQVTVFGQSAGGGSVAALLAMPRAAGLFRRAIVQSMPGVFFTPELAADIAGVLAAELGLKPAELATVAPGELPAVGDAVMARIGRYADRWGLAAHRMVPLGPVVDGSTLPTDPWQALAGGAARDVDLIVGHVRHEQRLFALIDGTLGQITEEQAATALSLFAPGPDGAAQYRAAGGSPEELYDQVHSDWLFRMPSLHLAEAHTGRTYVYELTWPAPGMGGVLGACHGLDVPLVFGNLTSGQPAMLLGDDLAEAEIVSAQMRARVDEVRHRRGSRLARVRPRQAPDADLRHRTGGRPVPGGGIAPDLAGPRFLGTAADHPGVTTASTRPGRLATPPAGRPQGWGAGGSAVRGQQRLGVGGLGGSDCGEEIPGVPPRAGRGTVADGIQGAAEQQRGPRLAVPVTGRAVRVQRAAAVVQRRVQVTGREVGVEEDRQGLGGEDAEAAHPGPGSGVLGKRDGAVDVAEPQVAGGDTGERHQFGVPGVGVAGEPERPLVVGERRRRVGPSGAVRHRAC